MSMESSAVVLSEWWLRRHASDSGLRYLLFYKSNNSDQIPDQSVPSATLLIRVLYTRSPMLFIIFVNIKVINGTKYVCLDGDPRSEFIIGVDSGSVQLARRLDCETQRLYNLTVSLTDNRRTVHTYVSQLYPWRTNTTKLSD